MLSAIVSSMASLALTGSTQVNSFLLKSNVFFYIFFLKKKKGETKKAMIEMGIGNIIAEVLFEGSSSIIGDVVLDLVANLLTNGIHLSHTHTF